MSDPKAPSQDARPVFDIGGNNDVRLFVGGKLEWLAYLARGMDSERFCEVANGAIDAALKAAVDAERKVAEDHSELRQRAEKHAAALAEALRELETVASDLASGGDHLVAIQQARAALAAHEANRDLSCGQCADLAWRAASYLEREGHGWHRYLKSDVDEARHVLSTEIERVLGAPLKDLMDEAKRVADGEEADK